jgi:glycerate-2-kinase
VDAARRRQHAYQIVLAALAGADAGRCLGSFLAGAPHLFSRSVRLSVVAAGKAAPAMLEAFLARHGERVASGVLASPDPSPVAPRIAAFAAGHPVPTPASEAAAAAVLALARQLEPADTLVVLLSGGASALLAAPAPTLTLDDKIAVTRALLARGASIDQLNAVRKHLSAIKGGRLAAATRAALVTLALSDVVAPVEDDPSTIGSGPTVGDPTTWVDAVRAIEACGLAVEDLPVAVRRHLADGLAGRIADTPKPGDPVFARSTFHVVGSRREAMTAAAAAAARAGFTVAVIATPVTGEARVAAPRWLDQVFALARARPRPCCVVASGETTVRVTGAGRGGRNQEFALAAALDLTARREAATVLALGTDGVDGPTDAAGAIVDETTVDRAAAAGAPAPEVVLAANDSYRFFVRTGDLLRTGPTRTNVGDLYVALVP